MQLPQTLSLGVSILLLVAYGLGLVFSLGTHRDVFAGAGMRTRPMSCPPSALAVLAGVTVLVALVSEVFIASLTDASANAGPERGVRRLRRRCVGGGGGRDGGGVFGSGEEPAGPERWHRLWQRGTDRPVRRPGSGAAQLCAGAGTDDAAVLAGRSPDDVHRRGDRLRRDPGGRSAWFTGVLMLMVYAIFALTLYLLPKPLA